MKAALDGLDAVKGDLSDGQKKYRAALSKMTLKTPTGDVKLDENRQAIGTIFVTEVAKDAQGGYYNKVVQEDRQRQPDARAVEGRVQDRLARRAGLPVMEPTGVIPAKAGIQCLSKSLGPRFRGGDETV